MNPFEGTHPQIGQVDSNSLIVGLRLHCMHNRIPILSKCSVLRFAGKSLFAHQKLKMFICIPYRMGILSIMRTVFMFDPIIFEYGLHPMWNSFNKPQMLRAKRISSLEDGLEKVQTRKRKWGPVQWPGDGLPHRLV